MDQNKYRLLICLKFLLKKVFEARNKDLRKFRFSKIRELYSLIFMILCKNIRF